MAATLLLASASPRRRELLAQAGYAFRTAAADIDEACREGEAPEAFVRRLALEKAQALFRSQPDCVVLGADTTVVCDGRILNKPATIAEAETMLRRLSGRRHQVHTGIAVVAGRPALTHVETTQVTFGAIAEDDLRSYLATGDSLDKAGGYGIQGYAARWIPRIEGDYFNVVGLPLAATVRLLREAGCK